MIPFLTILIIHENLLKCFINKLLNTYSTRSSLMLKISILPKAIVATAKPESTIVFGSIPVFNIRRDRVQISVLVLPGAKFQLFIQNNTIFAQKKLRFLHLTVSKGKQIGGIDSMLTDCI